MKNILSIIFIFTLSTLTLTAIPHTVGFQIGEVKQYKLLKKHASSSLYEIDCPQIQDGRPIKLLEVVGTHYEAGYAYGVILGQEIIDTYNTFMSDLLKNPMVRHIMQLFIDWQYDNLIVQKIPNEFLEELRGIQNAGVQLHKTKKLRNLIQRVLVLSSYPGNVEYDILYSMFDAFLQKTLRIKNPKLLDFVQNNTFKLVKLYRKFMIKKRIHCSFMATWGSKTIGGKLYSMRNLDWDANSGINKHKLITIWKIKDTIPHATIGFAGVIGALTGMSQAGLTVHQTGIDSMKATQLGFQWTLRLRYVLMHARNLAESKAIWQRTQNTFGMNHMIASAADLPSGQAPVFVVETMRGYNAYFADLDKREDGVNFTDPTTKKSFRAGYAMKDAVFRTNHPYDPTINKFRTEHPSLQDSTILRYTIIKDSLNHYPLESIGDLQALNVTANAADKGDQNQYKCPSPGSSRGNNVISVLFIPGQHRMYAAIEYGAQKSYRVACCGVYLNIDLSRWFSSKMVVMEQKAMIEQI